MTEAQYREAIIGFPSDPKSRGATSHIFLKPKIDRLRQQLIESKNEFEF